MALLHQRVTVDIECKDITIYAVNEEDYRIAIHFPTEEEDYEITEILFTADEIKYAYDLLFNR